MKDFEIIKHTSLKDYCTFKIGGTADFVFIAHSTNGLLEAVKYCTESNIKFKIIGLGANLLFDDLGYHGAVIVNRAKKIFCRKENVYISSGIIMAELLQYCTDHELSGIENLAGIPSSVGGAIVNNLGAFGVEIGDFVEYVEAYDEFFNLKKFSHDECKFCYRSSIFKSKNYIITKVKLHFKNDFKNNIKSKIIETINKKANSQPIALPSAGSVFKRCGIIPAKTIDELGLKGLRIGGAQISTKHAGFIVNLGWAKSSDVKNLIDIVKHEVKAKSNVELPLEIEIIDC